MGAETSSRSQEPVQQRSPNSLYLRMFDWPPCFRPQIHISKKYGFTKFNACDFDDMMAEKRLIPDGCGVKYIPSSGPLTRWKALHTN